MKNKVTTILLLFVFAAGLFLILYPLVSNYVNSKTQSQAITAYGAALAKTKSEECTRFFAEADAYNRKLRLLSFPFSDFDQLEGYDRLLCLENTNVMARISIEKIDVDLPVYHGSADATLSRGAGHLQGSSLPVGGAGTHAVLTAHRGLPSTRLFSDLNQLEIGDIFQITVLDRKLSYQVNQIFTVEADDLDLLRIYEGKDYCTLFTCTPYGINTHRLLVRGRRNEAETYKPRNAASVSGYRADPLVLLSLILAAGLLVILVVLLRKDKKRH